MLSGAHDKLQHSKRGDGTYDFRSTLEVGNVGERAFEARVKRYHTINHEIKTVRVELVRKYADRGFGPTVLIEAEQWSNRTMTDVPSGINVCEADTWECVLTIDGKDRPPWRGVRHA